MKAVEKTKTEERVTPEFRDPLSPIGYQSNDFALVAPDAMTVEDLTDPRAWALVKQRQGGHALATGDSVRVIHANWFADVVVDQAGRNEPCHVVVAQVIKRLNYGDSKRGLLPKDYDVIQNRATGHHTAGFRRGGEWVELGEYALYDNAAQACRDHADRVARK